MAKPNCRSKKNRSKPRCKNRGYVKKSEYIKREFFDSFIYIPVFLGFVFIFSYMGWLPIDDRTTLLWFTGIGAIAGASTFMISKYLYMNK